MSALDAFEQIPTLAPQLFDDQGPTMRLNPIAVLACAAVALGTACSSGAGERAVATTSPTTASTVAEPRGEDEQLDLELASSVRPSVSVTVPDEPIATAPAEATGVHLDVFALERQGDRSVLLVLGLRYTGDEDDYHVQRQLEDPDLPKRREMDYFASGVSLFDADNLKRHLVYVDDAGDCLCSEVSGYIDRGETRYAAALLPAPPLDVDGVTVQTPVGAVPDVPISDG
jgi:hypothetical protein